MAEIKAIPTMYGGILFRSRLEARLAVLFDACGVDWEYEPEGFDLGDGIWYLPDFLLHNVLIQCGGHYDEDGEKWVADFVVSDLYVEAKGKMTQADAEKINRLAGDFVGDEITDESDNTWSVRLRERPTYVVGQLPRGDCFDDIIMTASTNIHRLLEGHDLYQTATETEVPKMLCISRDMHLCLVNVGHADCDSIAREITVLLYQKVNNVLFDHGQTPSIWAPYWELRDSIRDLCLDGRWDGDDRLVGSVHKTNKTPEEA